MAKKVKFCYECDTEFTISYKGNDPILHCPFCGADLDEDEESFDDPEE